MKTKKELSDCLFEIAKQIEEHDPSQMLEKTERLMKYYQNECKQQELKIIRLETRLAEIRNLLNGANDK